MNDELDAETQQTPDETSSAPLGGHKEPEVAEDDKPGMTDFLKAAKDATKELKKQEP